MTTDQRVSCLAGLLALAASLATVPILEMGVNDDWSFSLTARELAESGRLRYYGWASPMIGVQAWWGALVIKIFGFSFTALRLSTQVFTIGCALLLFRLGRRSGLNPGLGLFGALAVVLSPLFIPLAASFMTDVPSLFFLLACVHCGLRALESQGTARVGGWMAAAALAGAAGGTVRQTGWILPLLLIPSVAFRKRHHGMVVPLGVGIWAAVAAGMVFSLRWFQVQPYALPTELIVPPMAYQQAVDTVRLLSLTAALVLLPALACHVSWRHRPKRWLAWLACLGMFCVLVRTRASLYYWYDSDAPWLGNILTEHGILRPGVEAIGQKPRLLSPRAQRALTLIVFAATSIWVASLADSLLKRRESDRKANRLTAPQTPSPRASPANSLLLLGPFCFCYSLSLIEQAWQGGRFDRYLIPLLPALLIALLWHYQEAIRPVVPAMGWVVLGVFAVYGIATTHDHLAAGRARLQAATALTAAGVPRTQITAGLAYDGWTQAEQAGFVNEPRIRVPPDAYRPQDGRVYPLEPAYWFWPITPVIEPRYLVVYSRQPGLVDSPFPPVSYTAWLPPFRRRVLVQMAPVNLPRR